MKYDFEANETMKRLKRCHVISADDPEIEELYELFEGTKIETREDIFMIAVFAYMLGRSRKNRGAAGRK